MSRFADLHLHTRYSDGSDAPQVLVQRAKRAGLAAIAVTDHDTLDGIAESLRTGDELGIEIIPGAEITCRVESHEIHMLGYLFGEAWTDANLLTVLDHSKRVREQRVQQFVNRLNELGLALTLDDVMSCSDCGTVGRPHVALALQRRGFVKSIDEAFERYLKHGRPGYVERYRITAAEAIGHIKRAGGIAVLAHPGLNKVDDRIREMVDQGLDGLEVWHSRHTVAQSSHYLKLTEQLGLLATGGSDDHGDIRGKPLLGTVKVPYERVEALKERAQARAR